MVLVLKAQPSKQKPTKENSPSLLFLRQSTHLYSTSHAWQMATIFGWRFFVCFSGCGYFWLHKLGRKRRGLHQSEGRDQGMFNNFLISASLMNEVGYFWDSPLALRIPGCLSAADIRQRKSIGNICFLLWKYLAVTAVCHWYKPHSS